MATHRKDDHVKVISLMLETVTDNFNRDGNFLPHILSLMPSGDLSIAILCGDVGSDVSQAFIAQTMLDSVRNGAEGVGFVSYVTSVCGLSKEEMLQVAKLGPAELAGHPQAEQRVRLLYETRSMSLTFSARIVRAPGAKPVLCNWTRHHRAVSIGAPLDCIFAQVAAEYAAHN